MIYAHRVKGMPEWCLSNTIMPAIEKGWQDEGKPVHFFWGLAGQNIKLIKECEEKKEDWWYIDLGYIGNKITRYPQPIIHDHEKTFFRICKGNIHTIRGVVGDGRRLQDLRNRLGKEAEFKGWYTGNTKHILLCPSSPTVTFHINGISQEEWIRQVTEELKKYTDRPIKFRNKPRPGNEWWETDILDDLKDAHCLITNMSLGAVDSVMNYVPVVTHQRNVCSFISSRDLSKIEKPMRPGRKTMEEWLKMIAENQFRLEEIENGTAYKTLIGQRV